MSISSLTDKKTYHYKDVLEKTLNIEIDELAISENYLFFTLREKDHLEIMKEDLQKNKYGSLFKIESFKDENNINNKYMLVVKI